VTTVEAFADIDVVRLLCVCGLSVEGLFAELREEDEDMAEEKLPSPWFEFAYDKPRRNCGGS
jgi:hypothetical protein